MAGNLQKEKLKGSALINKRSTKYLDFGSPCYFGSFG